MLPVFLSYFMITRKPKITITKKVFIGGLALALLLLPLVFITLKYSQINVRWIVEQDLTSRLGARNLLYYLRILAKFHLTVPVLILSLLSIAISVYRKDRRALIFLLWVSIYWLLLALTNAKTPRHAIDWIPPYRLFAAAIVNHFGTRSSRIVISCWLPQVISLLLGCNIGPPTQQVTSRQQCMSLKTERGKASCLARTLIQATLYFSFGNTTPTTKRLCFGRISC